MRFAVAALLVAVGASAAFLVLARGASEDEPLVSLPASPMPGRLLVGVQDDASLRWAEERGELLDRVQESGASVIRTIVAWHSVAPERPARPDNPFDPMYALDDVDDLVRSAQQRGVELLLTIWGTPAWANGGQKPNVPPVDPGELEAFARALADRYSGRHAGFPAVRLFSAWNEPNLEQFLSPQFDSAGQSVAPALYAPLARAVYAGVKGANPQALVAIGETSPRGHDRPSRGRVQDSHSPPRFARLLSELEPAVPFDAWAQHPYPPRSDIGPADPVRWPRVGLGNIDRFGGLLDEWFGRPDVPVWVTEYGHETRPSDPLGIAPGLQARFLESALALAAANPRIRMFVWFVLRDRAGNPWQSGLLDAEGREKPALATFARSARRLDARNPVLPSDADVVRVPALELAYHSPAGAPIEVEVGGRGRVIPLGADGWLEVPLVGWPRTSVVPIRASDAYGNVVERHVLLGTAAVNAG